MKRYIDMNEISDGKLYTGEDMVKADCLGCKGCHQCCSGMGQSVIIQPLDIHRLTMGLHTTFEALTGTYIELGMADGLILPNLIMNKETDCCNFLNDEGRCAIHDFRPSFCRLFPLGIYYESDGSFKYFLQTKECPVPSKAKVRVRRWIGETDMAAYESYVTCWHGFLENCRTKLPALNDDNRRLLCTYILKFFYMTPYGNDFYTVFYNRIQKFSGVLEAFSAEDHK